MGFDTRSDAMTDPEEEVRFMRAPVVVVSGFDPYSFSAKTSLQEFDGVAVARWRPDSGLPPEGQLINCRNGSAILEFMEDGVLRRLYHPPAPCLAPEGAVEANPTGTPDCSPFEAGDLENGELSIGCQFYRECSRRWKDITREVRQAKAG